MAVIGIVAVLAYFLAARHDLVERFMIWAERNEAWQIDEFVVLVGVLAVGLAIFSLRRWRDIASECACRLKSDLARQETEAHSRALVETLTDALTRLEILHQIDRAMLTAQSPQEIATVALDTLRDLRGPDLRANVMITGQHSHDGTVLVTSVLDNPLLPVGTQVPLAEIYALGTLSQHGIVHIDKEAITSSTLPLMAHLAAGGIRSVMMVPMVLQNAIVGLLNLGTTTPGLFQPDWEPIAIEVAEALALAIHQARLSEEVSLHQARLSKLSQRLMESQETERRRIARELHDQIGQSLVAIKLQLQSMSGLSDRDQLVVRLRESIAVVERTVRQVRDLSFDLRPSVLDDLGLVATLRWYVDRQARWAGVLAQFTANPPEMDLPSGVEVTAFRIAQEAITNALHHAQAEQVEVYLEQRDGEVVLRVQDNGIGFDAEAVLRGDGGDQSLGLLGMRERAQLVGGRIEIESVPEQGTMVQVRLPLPPSGSDDCPEPRPRGQRK
ncbi:MAG: GAF domain-containing sensor histidine kinase [Anaerolineae bacterium]